MSETREELLTRLVIAHEDAYSEAYEDAFTAYEDHAIADYIAGRAAAQALYTQALCDVIAAMEPIDWQDPTEAGFPQDLIVRFAAERGIDLSPEN